MAYGEMEAKMAWLENLKKHASKKMMEGVKSQFAPPAEVEEMLPEPKETGLEGLEELDEGSLMGLLGDGE